MSMLLFFAPNSIILLKYSAYFSLYLKYSTFYYYYRYHGAITREETARLLGKVEGSYLVRKGLSQSGTYSLSFV